MTGRPSALRLRLPATSANLGPGFDALGLAVGLYLTIDATVADEFEILATGCDPELCSDVRTSLILRTYREVLAAERKTVVPLHLALHNQIPLGKGCGSSAAALLAGVLLAVHFGNLPWDDQAILEEACRREGHPDNVAACWLGGMTTSAVVDGRVVAVSLGHGLDWPILLAVPSASLATEKARALLPESYSREDAVANVQSVALLVAAFALGRGDLLRSGMRDRMHQPYRLEACPLLARLLPMAREAGVLGVALSGAGPTVLVIAEGLSRLPQLRLSLTAAAGDLELQLLETSIVAGAIEAWTKRCSNR